MIQVTVRYPSDPPAEMQLMFGAEFQMHVRNGRPGQMFMDGKLIAEFEDIVCDSCNASVELTEHCGVMYSHLYCGECLNGLRRYFDHSSVKVSVPK